MRSFSIAAARTSSAVNSSVSAEEEEEERWMDERRMAMPTVEGGLRQRAG